MARVEGFVIFVPQAKAGQRTRIKIVQVGNRYANGQIVETVEKEEKSE
ncbi:MAG: TRAM domain-containing protein [archaeon]|nr:TRAM domain-containing protein [archaeon]